MPIIFEATNAIYAWMDTLLQHITNEYGVATAFAAVYYIVMVNTSRKIQKQEYQKRTLILKEMKEIHSEVPQKNGYKGWVNAEPTEEDVNKRNEQIAIVKKHKGKPGIILAAMLIQGLLFASFVAYFSTKENVPYYAIMPVVAVILSFFAYVTRKTVIINVLFIPLIYFTSAHFNGATNIYYDCVLIILIIEKIIIKIINKRNKTEKVEKSLV